MKRLYLRIYLAVLASLAVLALAAGLFWRHFDDDRPGQMAEAIATLALNSLPPVSATPSEQQAALDKLFANLRVDLTLYSADLTQLAAVGAPLPLPARDRLRSGRLFHLDGPPMWAVRLADERWLMARVPHGRHAPYRVIIVLALLALGIGIGAYPVVRRLTRRLERLQTGVEALGAGALSTRVAVEGGDEVARLAESFNHAAGRIEALIGAHKTLLANASHELRTPLARIRMGVELLKSGADTTRSRELERDIAELDALIEEILLASRLDAAPQVDATETVDLLALAAEECARYETATLDGAAVTLMGDARLLRRLIRNLLENARRHGAPPIEVTVRAREHIAEISVCDHGPGVPDAQRERVFEPFYRYATSSESSGAGLGLALVRQIARRHGGDAFAEGNCFRVELRR
jgi:signal transduction histidine kinase